MLRKQIVAAVAGLAIGGGLLACSGSAGASEPSAVPVTGPTGPAGTTGPTTAEPGERGTASYPDPLTPEPSAGPGKLAPLKLLDKIEDGDTSVAWRLDGYRPEVGQLVLTWASGSNGSTCLLAKGIRVVETKADVTVTAVGWIPPNVRIDCTGEKVVQTGYLDLAAPLGDRPLIHAAVDEGWTVVPEMPALP